MNNKRIKEKNNNKFLLFVTIAISIVFIFCAFFAGMFVEKQRETKTFVAKFGDIEAEIEYSLSDEVFSVIGHIVQKGVDEITINVQPESGFFRGQGSIEIEIAEIKINTNEQTKIIKIISLANGDKDYESISLSDLKESEIVQVFSNENIKGKSEFTASKINLLD